MAAASSSASSLSRTVFVAPPAAVSSATDPSPDSAKQHFDYEFSQFYVQDPLTLRGIIDQDKTKLIGSKAAAEFHKIFRNSLGHPMELEPNAFYVTVNCRQNFDNIPAADRVVRALPPPNDWFSWVHEKKPRGSPPEVIIPLASNIVPSTARTVIQIRVCGRPIEITFENPTGRTHAQVLKALRQQMQERIANPRLSPYVSLNDAPPAELIIGDYRFSRAASIHYVPSSQHIPSETALLTKDFCRSINMELRDGPVKYVKPMEFLQINNVNGAYLEKCSFGLAHTSNIVYTIVFRVESPGHNYRAPWNDDVRFINEGSDFLFLIKQVDPETGCAFYVSELVNIKKIDKFAKLPEDYVFDFEVLLTGPSDAPVHEVRLIFRPW
jgi:hypothetical protein